jgi:hypothetical protein
MKIVEERWILMDYHQRLIAKGVPRNRYICLVDGPDKKRVLTYGTENMARANNTGFYDGAGVREYIEKVYPELPRFQDPELYPVKVKVTMETLDVSNR